MAPVGMIVLFFFIMAIGIALSIGRLEKAKSLLYDWAHRNGLQLIDCERRALFRGPFFLKQVVYRITVEDANRQQRQGYARVGGWMVGLYSDQVDVRWD